MTRTYAPDGENLRQFMLSDTFVRGIRGPIGSGKSVACAIEIMRRAREMSPNRNNTRRSRWAVVRNSFPELKNTTIKTWLDWFPEGPGNKFSWTPPFTHRFQTTLPDGTGFDLEVIFLALDRDEDVKKLLSFELTGVWINEAREISKAIVDGATSRVGRFPSFEEVEECWFGVLMDTNSMPDDHWWAYMSGESELPEWMEDEDRLTLRKPDNWEFWAQPPAMIDIRNDQGQLTGYELNPNRENGKWTRQGYYTNLLQGKARDWIKVMVQNQIGSLREGKLVYPEYNDETHRSKKPTDLIKGLPVYVGIDFGLTPSAIFGQKLNGRAIIHKEITSRDMGAKRLAQEMHLRMAEWFPPGTEFRIFGDPAGDQRAQTDEVTPFQILRTNGINAVPAPGNNDFILRTEAVRDALTTMVDGNPGFVLSADCHVLRSGFMRGYHYKKIQVSGTARYSDTPVKNDASHPHDALQYLMIGMGFGRSVLGGGEQTTTTVAKRSGNIWQRTSRSEARGRPKSLLGQRF